MEYGYILGGFRATFNMHHARAATFVPESFLKLTVG
jgi:hypothetical protein